MAAGGQDWVDRVWYGDSRAFLVLLPLSWLYAAITALRRLLYRNGVLRSVRVGVPVIIVGNLSAGGTGKTPITIWLVNQLQERGFRPGVVSRGYRGTIGRSPLPVMPHSDPAVVGDEPVLIAKRCRCPVAVHPDRVSAAKLLEDQDVDVIVADDGLQHYRLQRDFEVVVIDGERAFGNGRLLPAGPLREPVSRLENVEQIIVNAAGPVTGVSGLPPDVPATRFRLRGSLVARLDDEKTQALDNLAGSRVHAVAAIGNPKRFFEMLSDFDIEVTPHPLPDHASITADDLSFGDGNAVVMTEKDAVKCRQLASEKFWYVPVDVDMADTDWLDRIEALIGPAAPGKQSDTDND